MNSCWQGIAIRTIRRASLLVIVINNIRHQIVNERGLHQEGSRLRLLRRCFKGVLDFSLHSLAAWALISTRLLIASLSDSFFSCFLVLLSLASTTLFSVERFSVCEEFYSVSSSSFAGFSLITTILSLTLTSDTRESCSKTIDYSDSSVSSGSEHFSLPISLSSVWIAASVNCLGFSSSKKVMLEVSSLASATVLKMGR